MEPFGIVIIFYLQAKIASAMGEIVPDCTETVGLRCTNLQKSVV
jgi:hypothetical protein